MAACTAGGHFLLGFCVAGNFFYMTPRLIKYYIYSAGLLLLITGVAKLISASGNARILQNLDPIFYMPFRQVILIVGTLELTATAICFFGKQAGFQAGIIGLLATNFIAYRIGLISIGYHKPCHCMGNLTDALHVSPQAADTAMKIILAYLLIGSYAVLFWLWRQRKQALSLSLTTQ